VLAVSLSLEANAKKPADLQEALAPYLKDIQKYMKIIREVRLDRKYDWHYKGLMEMLVCVSWFLTSLPSVPSSFVKETIGSSDFWSNKIRKEYKGKDKKHIDFCDTMKALIVDLAAYLKEYHLSGLMWNANGIPVKDFKSSSIPIAKTTQNISNKDKVQIAGSPDIMKELAAKQSKDGSSAATNLNKVSRDQQTWRKEFKKKETTATTTVKSSAVSVIEKSPSNKKLGKPICQFQSHGSKWIIENQTKTSNPDGICTVTTSDSKEQVYIYKCQNSTIQVKGKIKSVILDSCFKTNLVFDSAISSCEVINCERVQVQVIGVCPSFAIDKTDGCLIYLSKDSVNTSNIVSSKSTEMNVSFSDEKTGEQKECAIPEQFVHNIKNGMITSKVSDLYS